MGTHSVIQCTASQTSPAEGLNPSEVPYLFLLTLEEAQMSM